MLVFHWFLQGIPYIFACVPLGGQQQDRFPSGGDSGENNHNHYNYCNDNSNHNDINDYQIILKMDPGKTPAAQYLHVPSTCRLHAGSMPRVCRLSHAGSMPALYRPIAGGLKIRHGLHAGGRAGDGEAGDGAAVVAGEDEPRRAESAKPRGDGAAPDDCGRWVGEGLAILN